MNTVNVNCDVFSNSQENCVNNANCGWCGDRRRCIPGTLKGPLAPCLKTTYIYRQIANGATWNPLTAGNVNINAGGALHVIPQQ